MNEIGTVLVLRGHFEDTNQVDKRVLLAENITSIGLSSVFYHMGMLTCLKNIEASIYKTAATQAGIVVCDHDKKNA